MKFASDDERCRMIMEKLYTGVVSDCLDEMGFRNQAMKENIRPLDRDMVVAGRAKTILAVDVYHIHENPYEMEIKALDSIRPGEVAVVCTNNSVNNGIWGELMSTAASMRGSTGAITDGLIRDTKAISKMGFPIFCAGFKPVDSKGRGLVVDYDCPVVIGGITVQPGDFVFADYDGIVIIPKDVVDETLQKALEKTKMERHTREELLAGKMLRDVYEKYGVL